MVNLLVIGVVECHHFFQFTARTEIAQHTPLGDGQQPFRRWGRMSRADKLDDGDAEEEGDHEELGARDEKR